MSEFLTIDTNNINHRVSRVMNCLLYSDDDKRAIIGAQIIAAYQDGQASVQNRKINNITIDNNLATS